MTGPDRATGLAGEPPTGADAPVVEVIKPGLAGCVQDQGRPGQAALALSRGGAMDRGAMALANRLVGNLPEAAGIEITGPGPTLRFRTDAWIASVGARHTIERLSSGSAGGALPTQRPVFVEAGSVLRWHAPSVGWRSWIAVAGGIELPLVMGSRSAHLAAGLGPGLLRAGDRLPLAADAADLARRRARAVLGRDGRGRPWPAWLVAEDLPRGWPIVELPVLEGRHLPLLPAGARKALLAQAWPVSPQSNRQGLRLDGDPLPTGALPQLASEPVGSGTVQLPPAGQPVILLAEHQTTGGYPRVLEVASAAESLLAQVAAGCRVRFRPIGLEEADALACRRARESERRAAALRHACHDPPP